MDHADNVPPVTGLDATDTPLGIFGRLGAWCIRHRGAVIVVWVALFIGLGVLAPRLGDELTPGGFEIGGSDSQRVPQITRQHFSAEYASGLTAVIEAAPGSDATAAIVAANARIRTAAAAYPSLVRAIDPIRMAPGGRMGAVLIGLSKSLDEVLREVDPLLNQLKATTGKGTQVRITGGAAVFRDFDEVNERDLRRAELIQVPLVLTILLLVLGSVLAAGLPLLASAVAMVTTLSRPGYGFRRPFGRSRAPWQGQRAQ